MTQIAIDNRPRSQKVQKISKIKAIMKTANEAMEEALDKKGLNITELNRLNYATATIITEEINGTREYKLQTQRSKTSPWIRHIHEE